MGLVLGITAGIPVGIVLPPLEVRKEVGIAAGVPLVLTLVRVGGPKNVLADAPLPSVSFHYFGGPSCLIRKNTFLLKLFFLSKTTSMQNLNSITQNQEIK